jgi:hypothetical protein
VLKGTSTVLRGERGSNASDLPDYSPDLSQWQFNKMLGLGDKEHNRKLREERENKRPIITDVSKPVILWNVWVYYQKECDLNYSVKARVVA